MKKVLTMLMVLGLVSTGWSAEFALLAATTDVNFEWAANTEDDLGGYNIYRSDVSNAYDDTKLVGTVDPTKAQYIDPALPDGTYFWVATAFDTAGNESGYSVEVTAILDTIPPTPPKDFSIVPAIIVPLLILD